jgi:23S rRNA G2445 N2-methylase RlmL
VKRPGDGGDAELGAGPEFYLSVVPGLERIASSELQRAGAEVTGTRPGKVFFRYPGDPAAVLGLRSVMNVHAFIAEHHGCPSDAAASEWLTDRARQLDLAPAITASAHLREPPEKPSFRISATRTGEHDFSSLDVATWTGAAVEVSTGWRVDLERHDYDIEVELVGDRVLFGLRLGERWMQRRRKQAYHPASLNPTVAYAMIQMCGTDPQDVFLDPACGGGTLLAERAALAPARAIIGGDIWPQALECSRRNLDADATPALLVRWDARELPLCSGTVDRAASNLPFGHRIGRGRSVRPFYRRLMPEMLRVLRVGGLAALLTSRRRWMRLVIDDNPNCRRERMLRIVLGGKETFIFVVRRTS